MTASINWVIMSAWSSFGTISSAVKSRYGAVAVDGLSTNNRGVRAIAEARGEETFEFVVDEKPSHVGIDPYNKLIDRNSDDNLQSL